ncbi:MAG: Rpn family recombination-promoting nuclease/putative transposase [Pseudomonadota bacterium]
MTKRDVKPTSTPHDAFIRRTFDQILMAQDFFKHSLPDHILKIADLDTLVLTEKTFIEDDMSREVADMLFQVNLNGEPGYIYFLVEHMSSQNKWLPYRILKYVMHVIKYHMDNNPETKFLPIVVPGILHTGKNTFQHSLDIMDLFGDQKELAKQVMFKPPYLVDLPAETDEALQKFHMFQVAAMIAKHAWDDEIAPTMKILSDLLNFLWHNGQESYVKVVFHYIWQVCKTKDRADFKEKVKEILSTAKEEDGVYIRDMFKDVPEMLGYEARESVEKQGLERGLELGLDLGKKERTKEVVLTMLSNGATVEMVAQLIDITEDEVREYMHVN